jgi:hypothetical protein
MVSAQNFMKGVFLSTTFFARTNTIENTWRRVKAFLNPYNRMGDYIYHLAHYMLVAQFRSDNVDQFLKSNGIVATVDWIAIVVMLLIN